MDERQVKFYNLFVDELNEIEDRIDYEIDCETDKEIITNEKENYYLGYKHAIEDIREKLTNNISFFY
jgi:ribulose 1,5-bisphosphate carboxylase large subunit-like protein